MFALYVLKRHQLCLNDQYDFVVVIVAFVNIRTLFISAGLLYRILRPNNVHVHNSSAYTAYIILHCIWLTGQVPWNTVMPVQDIASYRYYEITFQLVYSHNQLLPWAYSTVRRPRCMQLFSALVLWRLDYCNSGSSESLWGKFITWTDRHCSMAVCYVSSVIYWWVVQMSQVCVHVKGFNWTADYMPVHFNVSIWGKLLVIHKNFTIFYFIHFTS